MQKPNTQQGYSWYVCPLVTTAYLIFTQADVSLAAAEKLVGDSHAKPVQIDVSDDAALDALIGQHNVVIWYVFMQWQFLANNSF